MTEDGDRKLENTIPVLGVSSLNKSIRFYTDVLGFKLDWGGDSTSTLCSISRDGHSIMLSEGAGRGMTVWVGMEDYSLFKEYVDRGVTVVQEPRNHPWAYDMQIADIDGNILWFGTGRRDDIPLDPAASP